MIPRSPDLEPRFYSDTKILPRKEEDHIGEVWWELDTGQAVMVMEFGDPRERGLVERLWCESLTVKGECHDTATNQFVDLSGGGGLDPRHCTLGQ